MSTKISAEIVADSINQQGDRITTYLLTFPRFILAELNTHRVFSKNSASSRAIPFEKMVEMVETDPFIPIAWQKDHKGMQGNEYITDPDMVEYREDLWLEASFKAIEMAKRLNNTIPNFDGKIPEGEDREGVTKQLCNRLLEPFMWHTVLLTATEFENFFELRCPVYELKSGTVINNNLKDKYFKSYADLLQFIRNNSNNQLTIQEWENKSLIERLQYNKGQAEIHIQALAEAMWDAMNESTPKELKSGEWHIPFGDKIDSLDSITDKSPIERLSKKINHTSMAYSEDIDTLAIKISTARCARLSYMTFDGEIDYEKDLKLHDTLLESQHMSPFEHCARAMSEGEYGYLYKSVGPGPEHFETGWCNNYRGFIQYRYLIENYYDGFKI